MYYSLKFLLSSVSLCLIAAVVAAAQDVEPVSDEAGVMVGERRPTELPASPEVRRLVLKRWAAQHASVEAQNTDTRSDLIHSQVVTKSQEPRSTPYALPLQAEHSGAEHRLFDLTQAIHANVKQLRLEHQSTSAQDRRAAYARWARESAPSELQSTSSAGTTPLTPLLPRETSVVSTQQTDAPLDLRLSNVRKATINKTPQERRQALSQVTTDPQNQ